MIEYFHIKTILREEKRDGVYYLTIDRVCGIFETCPELLA